MSRVVRSQRGASLVEVALALVVVALVGATLYAYLTSTTKTLETVREARPLSQARLAADLATLTSIRSVIQLHYAQHGQWPSNKEAVAALLNPPLSFQCAGNDYTYDPATGEARLVIDDLARC